MLSAFADHVKNAEDITLTLQLTSERICHEDLQGVVPSLESRETHRSISRREKTGIVAVYSSSSRSRTRECRAKIAVGGVVGIHRCTRTFCSASQYNECLNTASSEIEISTKLLRGEC